MRTTTHNFHNRHAAGFTLVELLLILLILGSLALLTTAVIDGVDEQVRYEDTKQRLTLIKRAIVGDASRTVNGEPEISGFVADVGRLPNCLAELVYLDEDEANPGEFLSPCDATPMWLWALDPQSGIWMGWRGPYLETGTSQVFRDGWGNKHSDPDEDAKNFGWQLSGMLTITSLGKDGADDGEDYAADQSIQIDRNDYQINLATWDTIEVEFRNTASVHKVLDLSLVKLRLALNYPEDGSLQEWPSTKALRDSSPFLSKELIEVNPKQMLPAQNGSVEIVAGGKITLSNPRELDPVQNLINVQAGDVITFKNYLGSVIGELRINERCVPIPNCTIAVPGHGYPNTPPDPVSVSEVIFTSDSTINIPPAIVVPVKLTAEGLVKVIINAPGGASLSGATLTLPLLATVSSIPAGSVWNPPELIMPTDSGSVVVTVSESFTLTGTQVVTSISGDVFTVPSGSDVEPGNKLVLPATLPVPIGIRSLNIVCDDGDDVVENDDGLIYKGSCPGAGTAGDSTLQIKLAPRQVPPLKPNPLVWNIE